MNVIDNALRLTNNEMNKCWQSYSTCKISGDFAGEIENGLKFIEHVNQVLRTLPDSVPLKINQAEVSLSIENTIITPVKECLKY